MILFFFFFSIAFGPFYVFFNISHNILLYEHLLQVLSVKTSPDVIVFKDFNVHHKGWLIWSGRKKDFANCYGFAFIQNLNLVNNFPASLTDYVAYSPTVFH